MENTSWFRGVRYPPIVGFRVCGLSCGFPRNPKLHKALLAQLFRTKGVLGFLGLQSLKGLWFRV